MNVFSFSYGVRFEVVPNRPILPTVQTQRDALDAGGDLGVGNDLLRH